MTRFARAKGSKASNERVPEKATPWNSMKTEFLKAQKEQQNEKEIKKMNEIRQQNYDNFLKEERSKSVPKKWVKFPGVQTQRMKKTSKINKELLRMTEADVTEEIMADMLKPDPEVDGQVEEMSKKIEDVLRKEMKESKEINKTKVNNNKENNKIKKKKTNTTANTNENKKQGKNFFNMQRKQNSNDNTNKTKKMKKSNNVNDDDNKESNKIKEEKPNTIANANKNKKQGKNFNKMQQKQNSNDNTNKIKEKNQKRTMDKLNKTPDKQLEKQENSKAQKRKSPEKKEDRPYKRRKALDINENTFRYDGFPVLQSDFKRLIALKKSLNEKGIPKSEIKRTMKLERRKAEKNLSRLKSKRCFVCRGAGHNLSECPNLNSDQSNLIDQTGVNICFKCGSTEHNYKDCKMNQGFKFAKCFICHEQGHISRECPDNPKGLYPNGGACRLCGDVTHLKKDCPKHVDDETKNTITLDKISSGNVESLELKKNTTVENRPKIFNKKVVKF